MIDFNADLGEGSPHDAALMTLIDTANICCGAHAGGPGLIRSTLELAKTHNVKVVAHPGYFDREHFGRRELELPAMELAAQINYQLGGFLALARTAGVTVKFLKPHGALYNQAMRDAGIAKIIVSVAMLNGLGLIGLPSSALETLALKLRIPFVREGFADRRYQTDGTLVPRTERNAFVTEPAEAVEQLKRLIEVQKIETVCVHGDNPEAIAFMQAVRVMLNVN
jgi:5-oxoprolinase (ATP-hydrolysing) subunit A